LVIATWAMVMAMGSVASAGAAAGRAEHPATAALIKSAAVTRDAMT
jgi:hypothetical protein